jgi:hypothetical protein
MANNSGASSRDFASRASLIAMRGSAASVTRCSSRGADEARVRGQQPLQQRGAAAHHSDDDDRRGHPLVEDLRVPADPLLCAQPHPQAVHDARPQDVHADGVEVGAGIVGQQHR